ncbi:MAG: C40 family peptidase [Sphingosinicella sp.]
MLADRILAPHFAKAVTRSCGAHAAMIRKRPDGEAEPVSELLPGEEFAVLEYAGGWAWGYETGSHMVGYVEAIELTPRIEPTHAVCEKCAPVAPDSRLGTPLLTSLPMGARLRGNEQGACLATEYGSVSLSHLRRIDEHDEDPVVVAERLIGVKWSPGGRSHHGVDAAGLVQLSLSQCGIAAPRLPDQLREMGRKVADTAKCRRCDIVFVGNVIGLMIDDLLMIHASEAAGKVTVEPISLYDSGPLERRRLPD